MTCPLRDLAGVSGTLWKSDSKPCAASAVLLLSLQPTDMTTSLSVLPILCFYWKYFFTLSIYTISQCPKCNVFDWYFCCLKFFCLQIWKLVPHQQEAPWACFSCEILEGLKHIHPHSVFVFFQDGRLPIVLPMSETWALEKFRTLLCLPHLFLWRKRKYEPQFIMTTQQESR